MSSLFAKANAKPKKETQGYDEITRHSQDLPLAIAIVEKYIIFRPLVRLGQGLIQKVCLFIQVGDPV